MRHFCVFVPTQAFRPAHAFYVKAPDIETVMKTLRTAIHIEEVSRWQSRVDFALPQDHDVLVAALVALNLTT